MSTPLEAEAPAGVLTGAPAGPAAAARVLVIDDDQVDRQIVRRGLARAGVNAVVDEAEGALDALSMLATHTYDCVFLDYNIPGGDGLTLLKGMRDAGLTVPVVMLTGHGDEQVAVELMKAGAVDYVGKSTVTPERLAASLRYAMELARAAAETRAAQEELRASAARARFLAEASEALAGSLDVGATLVQVARLSVPVLADYCLIYLAGDGGLAAAVASAHHDPALAPLAQVVERHFRPALEHPTSAVAQVIRSGQTRLMEPVTADHLASLAESDEEREAYRVLAPAAALFVPLMAHRVKGAVAFCRGARRAGFAPAEVALAEDLARRAGAALDNARLYEEAERARDRTQRLQEVTARLAAVLPRDEVARLFVTQVRAALGARTAWLSLLSEDGTELVAAADEGFEPGTIARFARVPVDAAMPSSDVLRTVEPRWYPSRRAIWEAYPALREPMHGIEQEAVALLPVTAGDAVLGVMTVGFGEVRDITAEELAFATALAQQCAQALERARLYDAERAARAEAEAARSEAEEANLAKSQFLARMSHDLRTPLNAIGGYADLVEMGIHGPVTPEQVQVMQRVRRAQQHLLTLINDILSFARLEAGQVRLELEDVPVSHVLMELRPLVEPQAQEKGLRLDVRGGRGGVFVRADRERLIQILLNLVSNAVKFTPGGGRVAITCAATGAEVSIRVRDTGPGIPDDRLEEIFDPFVQVGRSSAERRQGVGLGLAISRELARMMEGELVVESVVGEGSTFSLTLPRVEKPAAAGGTGPPRP
ncbi:MAG TPA: ATP-binding protein [Longimicrobium sp.]|nr:ATP-binding protein [Longimicrobium sp.]